jgi:hypothetical protein
MNLFKMLHRLLPPTNIKKSLASYQLRQLRHCGGPGLASRVIPKLLFVLRVMRNARAAMVWPPAHYRVVAPSLD